MQVVAKSIPLILIVARARVGDARCSNIVFAGFVNDRYAIMGTRGR